MIRNSILILLLALFSCSNDNNSNIRTDLIQSTDSIVSEELSIDSEDEAGWGADVRLSITKMVKTDTAVTYFTNSIHESKNVGFQITVPSFAPESKNALAQVLTIASSGEISDNFIRVLAKLYKTEANPNSRFVSSKRIAFIDLGEFAKRQLGKEPANRTTAKEMKLFFEEKNADDNAELYVNINEAEHWLEIREKDEEYRKQVIKGLTTK